MRKGNIDITFIIIIVLLAGSSLRSGMADPKQWLMEKLLLLPGIIIGLSLHEFGHAVVAYKLGDNTPKLQGRVTINPMAHIDWMGLAALFFCGFGWGQPVQINPYNFKHRRRDELFVSLAGVVMNLLVAVLFIIIAKVFVTATGGALNTTLAEGLWWIIYYAIQINFVLMIFNLIPCPPLDGFNIIAQIAGFGNTETYWRIYNYGSWFLIIIIVFGVAGMILTPCVSFLMNIVWGILF